MHDGGGGGARMIQKLLGRAIGVVWMKRSVGLWGEML